MIVQRSFYDATEVGRHGWIAGSPGTIPGSGDGRATWQVEPLPIELAVNWFRSVALLPGGRGLIVGAGGLLYATKDDALRNLRSARPDPVAGGNVS